LNQRAAKKQGHDNLRTSVRSLSGNSHLYLLPSEIIRGASFDNKTYPA
jgi:hypothetical protein